MMSNDTLRDEDILKVVEKYIPGNDSRKWARLEHNQLQTTRTCTP